MQPGCPRLSCRLTIAALTVASVLFALVLAIAQLPPEPALSADPDRERNLNLADAGAITHTVYAPLLGRVSGIYFDDFDDPSSGWYVGSALRWGDWCGWDGDCHLGYEEVAYMSYYSGRYHIYIPWTWHGGGTVDTWFVQPVQVAPLPEHFYPLPENYCIEARGIFANALTDYEPWWAHWGILFGATEDLSEIYTFQINANHSIAALRYHNYTYPGNRQPLDGSPINEEIRIVPWSSDLGPDYRSTQHNTLRIVVNGDTIKLIANDRLLNIVNIPGGIPRDQIGVIGGVWEMTPADIAIDYFMYEPNCTH